jgi:hypothetical protein
MSEPVELHQQYGDVEVHLDGNAHAWAWTPNIDDPDERLQLDLLPHVAFYCQTGRGKRVEPATWENERSLTIVVSVDLGTNGSASISGEPISERAVVELATAGLLATIRAGMEADLIRTRGE